MRELLEPSSIAVVGASATPGKSGYVLLKNLADHGFPGPLYPVNPSADAILGLRAYPSLAELPEPPDLVFIIVPREKVLDVMRDCEARKVRAVVIVSAGFGEVGGDGTALEADVRQVLGRAGIRAIGPNTTGFVNASRKLVGSFVPLPRWIDGSVALAGQSGLFAGGLTEELMAREVQVIGIRLAVAFGNKIDLDEVDFLDHASRDPEIRVIALHLEALKRPREFLGLARRVSRTTPVIVLKTGRTAAGARAAASHTGALAIEDRILDGAFRQANVVRAATVEEFLVLIRSFAAAPVPNGRRVGVFSYSGASGVMASDEIEEAGLALASLGKTTIDRISALMPPWQPVGNPVDVWLAAGGGPRQTIEGPLAALLDDPGVDVVLGILLAVPTTDFVELEEVFRAARRRHPDKPIFLVLFGGHVKTQWLRRLEGLDIPVESDTRASVRAIRAMVHYGRRRRRILGAFIRGTSTGRPAAEEEP
jgi:acetyltransferase